MKEDVLIKAVELDSKLKYMEEAVKHIGAGRAISIGSLRLDRYMDLHQNISNTVLKELGKEMITIKKQIEEL